MRVQFRMPLGSKGWEKHLEMPAVPRAGDTVALGIDGEEVEYQIRHVVWYPESLDIDAYVVLTP
jgi:hypothetical protein